MSKRLHVIAALSAALFLGACGDRALPTGPDRAAVTPIAIGGADGANAGTVSGSWSASSSGGTVKETLSGPAIDGQVPEGIALADQSQFSSGGSTILTVQVKKVNLRDGTVLGVTLDFTPVGSITIAGGEGTMRTDLGHFGVSRDQVRVKNGDVVILAGGFFQ